MTPEEIAAAFAAEGWTITTIAEACEEMERLSAGWRAQAAESLKWKHLHKHHCGNEACAERIRAWQRTPNPLPTDRSHMTYDELVKGIEDAPVTYLPALLITVVQACERGKVFQPGGLDKTVERAKGSTISVRSG